jgi:hypothetical protein
MSSPRQTEGHVLMPMLAIGSLALVLAAGFGTLGFMGRADDLIEAFLKSGGIGGATKALPGWAVWLAAGLGAFGLSAAILGVPGNWRRGVLLISALVVMAGWAPVLALASFRSEAAVPLLATFWAGLCALVYASRHHMPVDD